MTKARFVHTYLVAADWRALASFYQRVFGCEVVPPERHFAGPTRLRLPERISIHGVWGRWIFGK